MAPEAKTPLDTKTKKSKPVLPATELSHKQAEKTRNYLFLMGAIIAAVIIVGGYLIYRLATQFAHQSNLNRAQDELISDLNTKQKNLIELKPNYEAIIAKNGGSISDATRIMQAVPNTQDYENLIAILEKMGAESGVKVSSVSQSASTTAATGTGSGPIIFPFSVNIEGSYNSILEFLKKTEQSARVINFSTMSLSGGSGASTGGNISANLTMTTNYQNPANIESTFTPLK